MYDSSAVLARPCIVVVAANVFTYEVDMLDLYHTVNQQILAAIKFGVSQNIMIYVNLAAIKFGVSPRPVYVVYDRRICWR